MMLCSWQQVSNSSEWWLLWPLRINSRYLPFVRDAVWKSKCRIQSMPFSLVVQLLLVVAIRQVSGRLHSSYQLARWYCPAKMMNGGMAQPKAFTLWITVAYSRLPGWACLALPQPSEVVTTIVAIIMPIIKPVSLKLYESSLRMPYLTLMLCTSANYSRITFGSSYLALQQLYLRVKTRPKFWLALNEVVSLSYAYFGRVAFAQQSISYIFYIRKPGVKCGCTQLNNVLNNCFLF